MATPKWPDILPRPVIDDYGWSHVSPLQTKKTATGQTVTRRRFGMTPSTVPCSLRYLSKDEAIAFEGFIEYECNAGALTFLAPMETPRTEGVEWMYVTIPGYYDGPKIDARSGLYSITFTAQVLQAPIPSEDKYVETSILGGSTIEEALAAIQDINNHWDPDRQYITDTVSA